MMASIYTEIQLEHSDSIRILELSPLDTSASTVVLHGRLIRARLDQNPNYSTLSYVWGPPEYTHSITLNDSYTLSITETLFDALKELASDKASTRGLSLWIDQICINQADDTEKTSQVQMMSKIFGQARLVIGWLGPADSDSNEAMDIFRYLSLNPLDPEKAKLGQDLCRRMKLEWTTDQNGRSVNPLEQERNSAGLACVALLYRPWFRRLWIVQEVALAQKLELRCGSAAITDSEFFRALGSREWIARNRVGSFSKPLTQRISSLWTLRNDLHSGSDLVSFVSLAHDLQAWDCGNDHDRLNALYGIALTTVYGIARYDRSPWFVPDYSFSAVDLYHRFAKDYLTYNSGLLTSSEKGLDILHYAGLGSFLASHLPHSNGSSWSCPSWVPDWRIRNRTRPLCYLKGCSASTASSPKFMVGEIPRTLTVRGRLMTRIKHVPQTMFSATDWKIIEDIISLEQRYSGSNMEEFLSAIIMGGRLMSSDTLFDQKTLVKIFEDLKQRHKYAEQYESESLGATYPGGDEIEMFTAMALDLCRNRSFFETAGDCLGVGPAHVKEGDFVCLIDGLTTPFVVRTSDTWNLAHSSWILMGDCYVKRYMSKTDWGSLSDQEIKLV